MLSVLFFRWLQRDCLNSAVQMIKCFRMPKHLLIFLCHLRGETAEVFSAAVADEKGAGDDVVNVPVLVSHGPVQIHAVELSFLVADDAHGVFKGVKPFDIAAYGLLHIGEGGANLGDSGLFLRLHENYPNLPGSIPGEAGIKLNGFETKSVAIVKAQGNALSFLYSTTSETERE